MHLISAYYNAYSEQYFGKHKSEIVRILHTFHKHDSDPFANAAAQIFPKIALGNELAHATRMKQSGVITLISKLCIKP